MSFPADLTFIQARYGNEDGTAVLAETVELGWVALSEVDSPDAWAALLASDLTIQPMTPADPIDTDLPRREFRRALLHSGMDTAAVLAVIGSIPDPVAREEMMIWWEDTARFQRRHPILINMVAAAGLTPEQGDAIWSYGVGLLNGE